MKTFVTESLSDYIKPKSEEEIRKSLKNLSPQEKLRYGCEYGLLWAVQQAFDEGLNPNTLRTSALHLASFYGQIEIVKLLLKDPRIKIDLDNSYAIIINAIQNNNVDIVKLLLQDPRMDASGGDNRAIKWAENEGKLHIVKLLIKDPRVRNKLSPTQINYYEWKTNKIKESLSDYAKPKSEEEIRKYLGNLTPNEKLYQGCWYGVDWLVKEALDQGADPNFDKSRPLLRVAIVFEHFDIVKLLLQNKKTDIFLAVDLIREDILNKFSSHRDCELMKIVLTHPQLKTHISKDSIQYYINRNSTYCKDLLEINDLQESLGDYAKPKSKEEIKNLISKFDTPNKKLYIAVSNDILWLVKEALKEGANPNYENVLSLACAEGYYSIVKELLKHKHIDPNIDNDSAFWWACSEGFNDIAFLILNNPKVNPAAKENRLFNIAVDSNNLEIVKYLLKDPRIDPGAYNNYAIWITYSHGLANIMKLLLSDNRVKDKLTKQELNRYLNYLEYDTEYDI